ncbi:MAG: phosphate ABC transporter ATP-binding protein [Mycobacteriales bacterium]
MVPAEVAFELAGVGVVRGHATILDDVSARIPVGRCTALVGPSGAGKSTLLRLLNRFDDPTSGSISFLGRPLADYDVLELRRRVGLVFQRPTLLTERVSTELRVADADLTDAQAEELLTRTGLSADFLDRATSTLSGGEAQRLCLARALTVGPDVLLLDEPTSSLDAKSETAVEDTIARLAKGGLTVVLVSHDAGQAHRLADNALVLSHGRLVETGEVGAVGYLRRTS